MSAGPATAPRPRVGRTVAPRAPRRVSGPARPARPERPTAAPPRSRRPPRVPRATASARAVAVPRGAIALPGPIAPRAVGALRALPDARWLDRLLRGRGWILLIGVALIGLVFMQVSMLEMNAGIGRSVERSAALERQNADLRAHVSQLSSEERIQREALGMGLHMPGAGEVRYLTSRGAALDGRRAAQIMRAPDPVTEPSTALAAAQVAGTAPAPAAPVAPDVAPIAPVAETTPPAAGTVGPAPTTAPTTAPAEPRTAPAQPTAQAQPATPAAAMAGATAAPGSG